MKVVDGLLDGKHSRLVHDRAVPSLMAYPYTRLKNE
jgi:hypothetical protein